jgi:effector-binding domain-containing protein
MFKTAPKIEIVDLPQETFAFVVRRVEPDEAGEFVHGALSRVAEFAARFGGAQGPPTVISTAPDADGARVVEAGWPVTADAVPAPPVELRTLRATRALRHLHVGPFEELDGEFYADLLETAHEQGLRPMSAPRERYLDDPAAGEEQATEIVWPVS